LLKLALIVTRKRHLHFESLKASRTMAYWIWHMVLCTVTLHGESWLREPYEKWNIFVARPHLWLLQLGMVKPEI